MIKHVYERVRLRMNWQAGEWCLLTNGVQFALPAWVVNRDQIRAGHIALISWFEGIQQVAVIILEQTNGKTTMVTEFIIPDDQVILPET